MMVLLFSVAGDRYGIGVAHVSEVVPAIALQKLPWATEYVVGLLNYRGQVVPVIDLSQIIVGGSSRPCLSTRIILVKCSLGRLVGLMAEDVREAVAIDESSISEPGVPPRAGMFSGRIAFYDQNMIQLVEVEDLIPDEIRDRLYDGVEASSDADSRPDRDVSGARTDVC